MHGNVATLRGFFKGYYPVPVVSSESESEVARKALDESEAVRKALADWIASKDVKVKIDLLGQTLKAILQDIYSLDDSVHEAGLSDLSCLCDVYEGCFNDGDFLSDKDGSLRKEYHRLYQNIAAQLSTEIQGVRRQQGM